MEVASSEPLYLSCGWPGSFMNLGQAAQLIGGFLQSLAAVDPMFASGKQYSLRRRKSMPIELADPELESHLIEYLDKYNDSNYDHFMGYSDRDAQGRVTAASTHPPGFYFAFTTGPRGGQIKIDLYDGGEGQTALGHLGIEFPKPSAGHPGSPELAEQLLRASVAHLRPAVGHLLVRSFREQVNDRAGDYVRIGWLTYLGRRNAAQCLPAGADTERIPPGGVLVRLHGNPFDADDQAMLAEARRIRDALRSRGYLAETPVSEIIGRS